MRSFLALTAVAALTTLTLTAPASANAREHGASSRSNQQAPATDACTPDPRYAKSDLRAMWIASVVNIDWPARQGQSVQAQQQQLIDWFDLAQRNNFNAVVLQVRPPPTPSGPVTKDPGRAG